MDQQNYVVDLETNNEVELINQLKEGNAYKVVGRVINKGVTNIDDKQLFNYVIDSNIYGKESVLKVITARNISVDKGNFIEVIGKLKIVEMQFSKRKITEYKFISMDEYTKSIIGDKL